MTAANDFWNGGLLRAPAGWTPKKEHLQGWQFLLLPARADPGQPRGLRSLSRTPASPERQPQHPYCRGSWLSQASSGFPDLGPCCAVPSRFSPVRFFAILWTVAHQAPLPTGCSRKDYWSGLPFPPPGDCPNPGIKPASQVSCTGRQDFYHYRHLEKLQSLATGCEDLTHWKRAWCWERLKAGKEGDNRGWDGWRASLTRWTWVRAMDREAWRAAVRRVTESQTRLSDWTAGNKTQLSITGKWLWLFNKGTRGVRWNGGNMQFCIKRRGQAAARSRGYSTESTVRPNPLRCRRTRTRKHKIHIHIRQKNR